MTPTPPPCQRRTIPQAGDSASSPSRPPARESVGHPQRYQLAAPVTGLANNFGQYLLGLVAYLPGVGPAEAMVELAGLEEVRRDPVGDPVSEARSLVRRVEHRDEPRP